MQYLIYAFMTILHSRIHAIFSNCIRNWNLTTYDISFHVIASLKYRQHFAIIYPFKNHIIMMYLYTVYSVHSCSICLDAMPIFTMVQNGILETIYDFVCFVSRLINPQTRFITSYKIYCPSIECFNIFYDKASKYSRYSVITMTRWAVQTSTVCQCWHA